MTCLLFIFKLKIEIKVAPGALWRYAHSGGGNWQTAEIDFLGQANLQNKL